jgi:hypothetical protein
MLLIGLEAVALGQCEIPEVGFAGAASQDLFGSAVSVHGELAVVGAEQMQVSKTGELGYARVYRRTAGGWTFAQTLSPTNYCRCHEQRHLVRDAGTRLPSA